VELVHGSHTGDLWPRPSRVLVASRSAMFDRREDPLDARLPDLVGQPAVAVGLD